MKAILLAAGRGERLGALTQTTPKCLVEVGGEPLLAIWLRLLAHHDFDHVRINTHYLADRVESFLSTREPDDALNVTSAFEHQLLGTAGTIRSHRAWLKGCGTFLIAHADNLTNVDLSAMRSFHDGHQGVLTMGLFHTPAPEECGIATLDPQGWVTGFQEKPRHPASTLANGGVYLAREALLDSIPDRPGPIDFGFDVLPTLVGRMAGWPIEGFLADIGTPERLTAARRAWSSLGPSAG